MRRKSAALLVMVVGLAVATMLAACAGGDPQPTDAEVPLPPAVLASTPTPNIPATVAAAVEATAQTEMIAAAVEATLGVRRAAETRTAEAAESHLEAAVVLYEQGRLQQAIARFDEAIRLDPGYADAFFARGRAYGMLGQKQREIEDYDEAIRLDPGYAKAYHNRGITYSTLNQFQRAIEDFDVAIRMDPGFADSYVVRAIVHTILKNDEAAERDVERALELGYDSRRLNELIEGFKRGR